MGGGQHRLIQGQEHHRRHAAEHRQQEETRPDGGQGRRRAQQARPDHAQGQGQNDDQAGRTAGPPAKVGHAAAAQMTQGRADHDDQAADHTAAGRRQAQSALQQGRKPGAGGLDQDDDATGRQQVGGEDQRRDAHLLQGQQHRGSSAWGADRLALAIRQQQRHGHHQVGQGAEEEQHAPRIQAGEDSAHQGRGD